MTDSIIGVSIAIGDDLKLHEAAPPVTSLS